MSPELVQALTLLVQAVSLVLIAILHNRTK